MENAKGAEQGGRARTGFPDHVEGLLEHGLTRHEQAVLQHGPGLCTDEGALSFVTVILIPYMDSPYKRN